jgi:hypothetical protein
MEKNKNKSFKKNEKNNLSKLKLTYQASDLVYDTKITLKREK